jgi:tRNA-dihydrouridine synthase 3
MRTGIKDDKRIAHKLVDKYHGVVDAITLHGRSQRQRYTRNADWDYIKECVDHVVKPSNPAFCFLGNGDVYDYADYERSLKEGNVGAVMIGRSALQKPWVFTEIKERRVWDIRSTERFDMLKTFTNYGLEHWGADTIGVGKVRRFLCEWYVLMLG